MSAPTMTSPRAAHGGRRRLVAWWVVLTSFALLDVILTILGLQLADGRELNPLPAVAFRHSTTAAIVLRAGTLLVVLALALLLERRHATWGRRSLAVWSCIYASVDLYSLRILADAGVFA